ncbi:MAG: hypothetical protein HGB05_20525, partial [Chloroflexi bacterium]|nr:hypothetical protein [Chloroflexota bacterium]
NTAYPGVDGRFPTVWSGTPITQPAGPRHANLTVEGILGDHLSRENEADTGPDEDAINNILNGGTNNGNNDRGDDGWRNRTATFNHCEPTTLKIRVSKSPTATLNKMYLNVWFDGTHDGDWNDHGPCLPQGEQLQIPATEWIVQDYIVDMTGIAPGGFADITLNTETVLNTSPNKAHWLRFMLSESRAVQSNGHADGRGPNPANGSYQFGETEDYLQKPHPGGEPGTLEILKSVTTSTSPTPIGGLVTYEIRLKHVGGSQPIQAQIRDELAYGFRIFPQIVNGLVEYVIADSASGGAAPLEADYELDTSGSLPLPIYVVKWNGSLDPNSEITLSFLVQNLGLCQPNQTTQTVRNIAQARPLNSTQVITDEATFTAACPGYNGIFVDMEWANPITPSMTITDTWHWINYSGSSTEAKQGGTEAKTEAIVINKHPISVSLLISRVLTTSLPGSSSINLPGLEKITLAPSQTQLLDYGLHFSDLVTDELNLTDDFTAVQRLKYCILPGPNATQCPPIGLFPHLHGQSRPLTITVRPHDLGDAPDSTNHAGVAMAAYPAVQANYPTVYDPGLGLPISP